MTTRTAAYTANLPAPRRFERRTYPRVSQPTPTPNDRAQAERLPTYSNSGDSSHLATSGKRLNVSVL